MLHSRIVRIVTTVEIKRLLKYQRQIEPDAKIFENAARVTSEPVHLTGVAVVSASGFSAVAIAHAIGMSQMSAMTTATTSATMEPLLRGIGAARFEAVLGATRVGVSTAELTWPPRRSWRVPLRSSSAAVAAAGGTAAAR